MVAVFAVSLWVLRNQLEHMHHQDVLEQWRAIPLPSLLAALALTAVSYALLTLYDLLALRTLGRSLPYRRVATTSFIAYALSNNLGLASLTGGSMRLRAYTADGLGAVDIAVIQALCTLSFFLGCGFLAGLSLVTEAGAASTALHVSPWLAHLLGSSLLAIIAGYMALTLTRRKPVLWHDWSMRLPSFEQTMAQLMVGSLDLVCSAAVLYVLLPEGSDLRFASFVGIYVIAVLAGALSNVPGGIGVFESVLLLLMRAIPSERMVGALLMYRVIYYGLPFIGAIVTLAWREWKVLHHRVSGVASRLGPRVQALIPYVMAISSFAAGALLLVSGTLPALSPRLNWLADWLPLSVLEFSHLAGSAVGVGLLILSRGLSRRIDGAWWLTMLLLGSGIVSSLLKGLDYEEASLLALLMVLLGRSKALFHRRASLLEGPISSGWWLYIGLVIGGSIWLGLFAYRRVDYSTELWWRFAFDANAPRMLRASLLVVIIAVGFALRQLLGASRPEPELPDEAEIQKARQCVDLSRESMANLALLGDKQLMFSEQNDAFIMYRRSGSSWIALGDPVGNPARYSELVWRFRELADEHGGRCAFYQVSPAMLPLYLDLGLSLTKLGEEARVPLADFSLEGSKRAELRTAHRKGAKEGVSFEVLPPEQVAARMDELRAVSDQWLEAKSTAEKRFSVGCFDPLYLARFHCAVALREGRVVAFANLWQSGNREELTIDLMRYSHEAPKGVMDYLFVSMLLWGKEQGFQWFNLGMAPLSGLENHPLAPLWHKLGLLLHRYGETFYNFEGLRKYKEKFLPQWRPRYLASPGGLALPSVLIDTATLISGGVLETIRK